MEGQMDNHCKPMRLSPAQYKGDGNCNSYSRSVDPLSLVGLKSLF